MSGCHSQGKRRKGQTVQEEKTKGQEEDLEGEMQILDNVSPSCPCNEDDENHHRK